MSTDLLHHWAGSVAFNALLSLFPLLLAATAIGALFVDEEWAVSTLEPLLADVLPLSAELVGKLVREAIRSRGTVGIIAVLTLLWTGSRVFNVLTIALNIAFDVDETFSFWRRTAFQLALTATLGILFVLALSSGAAIAALRALIGAPVADPAFWFAEHAIPLALIAGALTLLYQLVPRCRTRWAASVVGAIAASALLRLARPLFVFFVERFATYNATYGSLAVVILLLMWMWLTALIILWGGEIASHTQAIVLEGRTPEEVAAAHDRRGHDQLHPRRAHAPSQGSADGSSPPLHVR